MSYMYMDRLMFVRVEEKDKSEIFKIFGIVLVITFCAAKLQIIFEIRKYIGKYFWFLQILIYQRAEKQAQKNRASFPKLCI